MFTHLFDDVFHLFERKKILKDLDDNSVVYVSNKSLYLLLDINPQDSKETGDFQLFLDLNSDDYYPFKSKSKNSLHKYKIKKISKNNYIFLEPINNISPFDTFESIAKSREDGISKNFSVKLIEEIKFHTKGANVDKIYSDPDDNPQIIDANQKKLLKYFNSKYFKIAGRRYTKSEKSLVELNVDMENFTIKKPNVSKREIEALFDDIILDDKVKQNFFEYIGLNELIDGKIPDKFHQGVILIGPPRTGKSLLMERAKLAFAKLAGLGNSMDEIDKICQQIPEMQAYVGEGTRKGKEAFSKAQIKAKTQRFYSILYMDEAINIVVKKEEPYLTGNSILFYQELQESLKSHIGNKDGMGVISIFAANPKLSEHISEDECRSELDGALAEDGRLKMIYVGLPSPENASRIFRLFINKFLKLNHEFSNSQYLELGNLASRYSANGGNIESFCKLYRRNNNLSENSGIIFSDFLTNFDRYMIQNRGERGFSINNKLKNQLNKIISDNLDGLQIHNPELNHILGQEIFYWVDNKKNELFISNLSDKVIIKEFQLLSGFIISLFKYINNSDLRRSSSWVNGLNLFNILDNFFNHIKSSRPIVDLRQMDDLILNNFNNFFNLNSNSDESNSSSNNNNNNNNNNSTDNSHSNNQPSEEYIRFMSIYNDSTTQRIIHAENIARLLNINPNVHMSLARGIWRQLTVRYQSINGESSEFVIFNDIEFRERIIIRFVTLLNRKISTFNPRTNRNFSQNLERFNFSEFDNYARNGGR